jgi:hypothetical protein
MPRPVLDGQLARHFKFMTPAPQVILDELPAESEASAFVGQLSRQQSRYWTLFNQLLAHSRYVQLRFERKEKVSWWLDLCLAVATSASVGAWLVWEQHRVVWATIAAASQVVSLIRKFLPNEHNVKALREGASSFKLLVIECEAQLHSVLEGILTDEETSGFIEQFQKKQHDIEEKMFVTLSDKTCKKNWALAEEHANDYIAAYYGK